MTLGDLEYTWDYDFKFSQYLDLATEPVDWLCLEFSEPGPDPAVNSVCSDSYQMRVDDHTSDSLVLDVQALVNTSTVKEGQPLILEISSQKIYDNSTEDENEAELLVFATPQVDTF